MSEGRSNISQKICELCSVKASKYCCPRCNVLYCSLECYKANNHAECSESFYRDCVNEELASYHADDESKRSMIDILKKMQAGDIDEDSEPIETINADSDDEEESDLHDRIQGLNLNDADALWNVLTEDERNEFEALLSNGDVGSIVPQWEPWWMYRKEKKMVEETDKKDNEEEMLKNCPALKTVPKMSSLTTVQPSPAIGFNIANVLASYAFIMRYFNGEIEAVEAAANLLDICTNLDMNTNFEDLALAVESVAQKCLQSELIETDQESLNVMKQDILLILQGPSEANNKYYCKAALSHLHQILSQAKTAGKHTSSSTRKKIEEKKENSKFSRKFPEHSTSHLPSLDVSKLKKCIKKIEYYLSFVESCSIGEIKV